MCAEYVQQYHSVALLENDQKIPRSKRRPGYEKENAHTAHRSCKLDYESNNL